MKKIVGISFNSSDRIEYFYTNNINVKKNLTVIVETEAGLRFGKVMTDIHSIDETKVKKEINDIVRIASKQDYHNHQKNLKDEKQAKEKCIELAEKYNLNMNIVDTYYTFDRNQLIFKFLADTRLDFRELAKELASIYHTRIELRQIGVRDKAKEIGGLGCCGQKLCCSRFLKDFESVSISMAKNQNLALNPNKINGICGRLLCCLNYENDCYKECRKNLPKVGQTVETEYGEGKVVSLDPINNKYQVETKKGIIEKIG